MEGHNPFQGKGRLRFKKRSFFSRDGETAFKETQSPFSITASRALDTSTISCVNREFNFRYVRPLMGTQRAFVFSVARCGEMVVPLETDSLSLSHSLFESYSFFVRFHSAFRDAVNKFDKDGRIHGRSILKCVSIHNNCVVKGVKKK